MLNDNLSFLYFYLFVNILYFIVNLFFHSSGKNKFYAGFILNIFICIMYALRSKNIGSDGSTYALLLTNAKEVTQQMSPLIIIIGELINKIDGNIFLFFFIISLIIILPIYIVFYKIDKNNFLVIMAVFSTSFLFLNSNINILRQGMAISLFTAALYFIYKNNILKFFILSILAILTHSSAIIIFIIPFFMYLNTKKRIYTFISIMLFCYFLKISIVNFLNIFEGIHWSIDRLLWYLTWQNLKPFRLKHVYFLYIIIIFIYLYKYNYLNWDHKRLFSFFLSILFIIIVFQNDDFVVDRFSFYLVPIVSILYVNMLKLLSLNKRNIYVFIFIILPFMWIFKSAYQFNQWWVLGIMR